MTVANQNPTWLAKNRNTLFLMACVILGQAIFYVTTTANSQREVERYKSLQLASHVAKVLSYSQGMQKVRLATGETPALALPTAGREYLQAGDSLVKEAGSDTITVYRRFSDYTEVSVFGPSTTAGTGLVRRYQLRKP